jgi:hypothetical protein
MPADISFEVLGAGRLGSAVRTAPPDPDDEADVDPSAPAESAESAGSEDEADAATTTGADGVTWLDCDSSPTLVGWLTDPVHAAKSTNAAAPRTVTAVPRGNLTRREYATTDLIPHSSTRVIQPSAHPVDEPLSSSPTRPRS